MSNKTGMTLLALVTGVAVGAGIGILFAPEKGSKTRGKIKKKYLDNQNELKEKYNHLVDEVKTNLTNKKVNLEETYDDLISNVSYKTENVISFLEIKLAELKDKNAKFQK
ncbi:MAG: hypothetical protein QG594_450 [Bacteroidota bacterium]|nr:hypothetical protein [Bacteroidota bacterium]